MKSMMIVTYDEHGGFFDHVSPTSVATPAPNGEYQKFDSLGVRVPAFVVSPFVEPRSVYHHDLDHTAILQLLGERFGNGQYSAAVNARMDAGLESVSATLSLDEARADVPAPPGISQGFTTQVGAPFDPMSQAFAEAFAGMSKRSPADVARIFPKLSGHFGAAGAAMAKPRKAAAPKLKTAAAKKKSKKK